MAEYEIRRSGGTVCHGSLLNLGYTQSQLRQMERDGHHLYCDGRKVKKSAPDAATSKGGKAVSHTANITNIGGFVNE